MVDCSLYIIRHKTRPIMYIGLTSNIQQRFREHKNDSSNKLLKAYFKELGTESFLFTEVVRGTRADIEELEELVIVEAKSLDRLEVCNVLIGSVFTGDSSQIGEKHWNAKFTEQDISDIREIYAMGGITQKQIGEIYGVSNKVISKITSGDRWKNVSGILTKNSLSNRAYNRRKITNEQVVELRNVAYDMKILDLHYLSKIYNMHYKSIRRVLNGTSYPNIPGPLLGVDYD